MRHWGMGHRASGGGRGKDWPLQITSGSRFEVLGSSGGKTDQEQQMSNQFLYRNDDNKRKNKAQRDKKEEEGRRPRETVREKLWQLCPFCLFLV